MTGPEDLARLAAVLDTLIPPDAERGMPGAGALGLASAVAPAVDTDAWRALADLGDLAALPPAERTDRLRRLDTEHPGIVGTLHYHAIQHYYQHPDVVAALGVERHPPWPGGFTLEPGDLGALERVRARGPRYREV